jgi:hypothetical protein
MADATRLCCGEYCLRVVRQEQAIAHEPPLPMACPLRDSLVCAGTTCYGPPSPQFFAASADLAGPRNARFRRNVDSHHDRAGAGTRRGKRASPRPD